MYQDSSYDRLNESRQNDSRLNESLASNARLKRKKTLEDYEFVLNENSKYKTSELGKGAYGVVKKVKDRTSGKVYAMKIMSKKAIFEYSNKENLKREINIQKGILHPHIVRLYTYFEDNENVYLILEYAENGSLFHYIRRKKKFLENEAFVYFFQTCLGIDYLHKREIIHRDLKPENLLLDEEGNIKICDFGWSAQTSLQRETFCGTIDYMAPEMIKNQPHDHRLDIWCLGVLLYEMLHGYAPFKGRSDQEKTMNISMNMPIQFDPTISPEAVDLMRRILQASPVHRLPMQGIFEHPWMKNSEKIYDIDIRSYVEQQDEQIRELKKAENNKSMLSHQTSAADITDRSIDRGIQPLQATRHISSERSTGNNAKIITIQDTTSPVMLPQKVSYEEPKKLSYNSTKASESSSIGSGAGTNTLSIEQLLKSHSVRTQEPVVEHMKYKRANYDISKSQQFTSEYLNSLMYKNTVYTPQNLGRDMGKEYSFTGRYELDRDAFKNDIADGHSNRVYIQKQKSAQIESPTRNLYNSEKKDRRQNYYESSYRDKKLDARSNSIEKLYTSDMNDRDRYGRLYSAQGPLIYEEADDYEDFKRLSKVSMRNREINNRQRPNGKEKDVGLFEKILVGLGCIARDGKKYKE